MIKFAKWAVSWIGLLLIISGAYAESPIRGAATAPVSIIVFSAFTCPYCAEGQNILKQLQIKYPGKIQVIFKHMPLGEDEYSLLPHEAVMAAAEQGKFWEMHDSLYEHQSMLTDANKLSSLAEQLKLDLEKFKIALNKHATRAIVQSDIAEANALKVNATPTFYIDGFKLEGLHQASVFEEIIDHQLAKLEKANKPSLKTMINSVSQENSSPLINHIIKKTNKQ